MKKEKQLSKILEHIYGKGICEKLEKEQAEREKTKEWQDEQKWYEETFSDEEEVDEDTEWYKEIEQGYYEDLKISPEDNKFYYGWDWC